MLKKQWLRLGVALLPLYAAQVWAAPNQDTGPGCGLGKLAWSEYRNQKDIAPQVMQSTTNNTFGSQTFGISFGTSGCTNNGVIMSEHKTSVFAALNFENLSQDMAKGDGEHSPGESFGVLCSRAAAVPEHDSVGRIYSSGDAKGVNQRNVIAPASRQQCKVTYLRAPAIAGARFLIGDPQHRASRSVFSAKHSPRPRQRSGLPSAAAWSCRGAGAAPGALLASSSTLSPGLPGRH